VVGIELAIAASPIQDPGVVAPSVVAVPARQERVALVDRPALVAVDVVVAVDDEDNSSMFYANMICANA
jgi:hypothetical protein